MTAGERNRSLFLIFYSTLLILSSLLLLPEVGHASGQVTIETNTLNVRSGPGLDFDVIEKVNKGEKFSVIEQSGQWYKVQLSETKTGWVAAWLVNYNQAASSIQQAVSNVPVLNVRSGPGTSFSLVSQITSDTHFPVLKQEGEWVQIRINDQLTGWVASWLVNLSTSTSGTSPAPTTSQAVVQATTLNVRSGPGTSHGIIAKLSQGDSITVLSIQDGWYKIKLSSGSEGWVASDYIQDQSTPASSTVEQVSVIPDILNLRSQPSTQASILTKLERGNQLKVISSQGDWLQVEYQGTKGWVAKEFVQTSTGSSSNTGSSNQNNAPGQQVSNQPVVKIVRDGTNIRSSASLDSSVVHRGSLGETYNIISTEGEWYQIQLANGTKGYVASWVVVTEGIENVSRQGIEQYFKGKKIVVDPGHGGKDQGAKGSHFNTLEKVVNLQVSNLLREKLKAAGANVVMTRADDRFITLQQRVDVSINEKADLFLSIHHNTHNDQRINGSITYYYHRNHTELAKIIQSELVKYNGLQDLRARYGNFFVLRENPRPAVLIEIGYLSNYNDELRIRQSSFQENSANGIFYGVAKYFQSLEDV